MKNKILIASILMLQIAGPALAQEMGQSEMISPGGVDITGIPEQNQPSGGSASGQSELINPAEAGQTSVRQQNMGQMSSSNQFNQANQMSQSGWINPGQGNGSPDTELKGTITKRAPKPSSNGNGYHPNLAAIGSLIGAAATIPMAVASMRAPVYGGYYRPFGFGYGYAPRYYGMGNGAAVAGVATMMGGQVVRNVLSNIRY